MAHIRQQIREAVGSRLNNLTTTGTNVYQSRVFPIETAKLPTLIIYTTSESNELLEMNSPRTLQRTLNLTVEAYAKNVTTFDDLADTINAEVEVAMSSDVTFGGLSRDSFLESVEINFNGEGDQPLAVLIMNYSILYLSRENAPNTAI